MQGGYSPANHGRALIVARQMWEVPRVAGVEAQHTMNDLRHSCPDTRLHARGLVPHPSEAGCSHRRTKNAHQAGCFHQVPLASRVQAGFHQTPALFAASKAVPPSTRAQHVSVCAMFPEWAFLADKSADRYKMSLLSSFQKCLLCRYPANLFF